MMTGFQVLKPQEEAFTAILVFDNCFGFHVLGTLAEVPIVINPLKDDRIPNSGDFGRKHSQPNPSEDDFGFKVLGSRRVHKESGLSFSFSIALLSIRCMKFS